MFIMSLITVVPDILILWLLSTWGQGHLEIPQRQFGHKNLQKTSSEKSRRRQI